MRFAFLFLLCSPAIANEAAVVRLSSGCSGVCVSADGLILTADHCGNDQRITVTFPDGVKYTAEAEYIPPRNGIDEAQTYRIKTDGSLPFARIATQVPKAGDRVAATGYPAGNYQRNAGRVQRVGFATSDGQGFSARLTDGIVTDWGSDGGNSGGPLFNADGEVVGLLSMSSTKDPRSYWIGAGSIREAIKRTQEPVAAYRRAEVIVFVTDGCGPCERLKADVKAGKFAGHTFRFVSYNQDLRQWSDLSMAKEFAQTAKAPAGLGFPVIWVRGSTNYRTGYDPNQRSGLLGWITRVLDSLGKLIVGERPAPPFPEIDAEGVPVPVPDELPPTPVETTKAALEALRNDLLKAKGDLERLKSANPIEKARALFALKSDAAKIKNNAQAALDAAKGAKDDAKEKPLQYLWGLFGILSGLAHRRFAA